MSRVLTLSLTLAVLAAVAVPVLRAEDEKPKYDISEVMKKAHGGGAKSLLKKVVAGEATAEDKALLLDLYIALGKNEPPKGEAANWKKLNESIIAAAKEVADGKAEAGAALDKATNCKNCHMAHKS